LPVRAAAARSLDLDGDGQVMGTKNDRILWLFPNYRTVDQDKSQPTITRREKLSIAFNDSFDPYAFPVAGLFAGIAQLEDRPDSWSRDLDGYRKRYLAALADQTISNVMAEAVFPIMLKQDPRYFRLGRGGLWHRAGYALTRIFVTRTDSREPQFNYSEFGGNAVMASASIMYRPRADRTVGNASQTFALQLAMDSLSNVGKEFWPDIKAWLTGRPAP
jgi:hypothetical protein